MSLDCIDCHPEIHTDCSTPKTRKQHWRCVTHQKENRMTKMRYVVKEEPDDGGPSFWHVIDTPELPSWTEDREAHGQWWEEHVRPLTKGPCSLEIVRFPNEDYVTEGREWDTQDFDAVGVEWEFGDD